MDRPSLLLTRPRASAERFVAALEPSLVQGSQICIAPLLEIVPTGVEPKIGQDVGVIFSSANGVAFGGDGQGRVAFCVGEITAQAATAKGWAIRCVGQTADDLIGQIIAMNVTTPLVHLAGKHRRGEIASRLKAVGMSVEEVTLYDQKRMPLSEQGQEMLTGEAPVIVPLFSPRTAVQFASEAVETRRAIIVAISPAVADSIAGCDVARIKLVSAPTRDEMRHAVELLLSDVSST